MFLTVAPEMMTSHFAASQIRSCDLIMNMSFTPPVR
jgi:hypothetical protein